MKERWIERGISIVMFLAVSVGWLLTATVNRTKAEAEQEYIRAEQAEMKEDVKDVKRTVEDTNIRVNENANNITRLTTIAGLDSD